eukprot:gene15653-9745_t
MRQSTPPLSISMTTARLGLPSAMCSLCTTPTFRTLSDMSVLVSPFVSPPRSQARRQWQLPNVVTVPTPTHHDGGSEASPARRACGGFPLLPAPTPTRG